MVRMEVSKVIKKNQVRKIKVNKINFIFQIIKTIINISLKKAIILKLLVVKKNKEEAAKEKLQLKNYQKMVFKMMSLPMN